MYKLEKIIDNINLTIQIIPEYDYPSDELWEKAKSKIILENRIKKIEKIKKSII